MLPIMQPKACKENFLSHASHHRLNMSHKHTKTHLTKSYNERASSMSKVAISNGGTGFLQTLTAVTAYGMGSKSSHFS